MSLYPLKFVPIFKDKLWGGQKIRTVLGKDFGDLRNCGETWELSGVEGNISVVRHGSLKGRSLKELIDQYQSRLLGEKIYNQFGNDFPLLIKFIDANDDLSIQVHPNDELARQRHNSFGKTEMWYILQADKGAQLISGFNRSLSKKEYLDHFNGGTLESILNREDVDAGDVFFLPAGRIHTIGQGLLLAEIQQTSDVTYRIYDFNRVDANGKKRELHTEQAIDALDYEHSSEYKTLYDKTSDEVNLADTQYFTTQKLNLKNATHRDLSDRSSFTILIGVEGEGKLAYESGEESFGLGEVTLIPAELSQIEIKPKGNLKALEVYIK